jgi:flagellar basal-body rod protein FlgF
MWVGVSGAIARLREIDVISNNLANSDTVGFKRERVAFASALESAVSDLGVGPARGAPGRSFVVESPGGFDATTGAFAQTGGPLDVAIAGDGWFEVETARGPRFTRAGAFAVASDGTLVTQAGDPVMGAGGPIATGDGGATILPSGDVIDRRGIALGRLRVVAFEDPNALEPEGGNLFALRPDAALPAEVADPRVAPGSLERSNVQPVSELASLVLLQRAFEVSVRSIQSDDESTQRLIEELSG